MENTDRKGIRIILARHGETDWNLEKRFQGKSDIPLNSTGHDQAQSLALALQYEPITAIYSSPLKRALETAKHIQRFHSSIHLTEEPGFMEMDLGEFEGLALEKWKEHYYDFRKRWIDKPASLAMPSGESLLDVQQRAVDSLSRICALLKPGSTLLICSHNFVIVSILCFAAGKTLNQFRDFRQNTASLNILTKQDSNFLVEKVNDTRHLDD